MEALKNIDNEAAVDFIGGDARRQRRPRALPRRAAGGAPAANGAFSGARRPAETRNPNVRAFVGPAAPPALALRTHPPIELEKRARRQRSWIEDVLSWCFPLREFTSPMQRILSLSVDRPGKKPSGRKLPL